MTKITYTINKHFYHDKKPCQCVLFENLESREIAQKLIKSARLQNKRIMESAKKSGDTKIYDQLFNRTFSITINISTTNITTL